MIFYFRRKLNAYLLVAVLGVFFSNAVLANIGIEQVLEGWSTEVAGTSLDFDETRYDEFLDLQINYSGQIFLQEAGGFQVVYHSPSFTKVILDKTTLTLEYPKRTQHLDLTKLPELQEFFNLFLAMLAGDFSLINTSYNSQFLSSENAWSIGWERKGGFSNKPPKLNLSGSYLNKTTKITTLRIDLANGDWREFSWK